MQSQRTLGWILLIAGAALALIGVAWGGAGYYVSQTPILLLLVLGGGGAAVAGGLLLRKPKQDSAPVSWRPPTDRDD